MESAQDDAQGGQSPEHIPASDVQHEEDWQCEEEEEEEEEEEDRQEAHPVWLSEAYRRSAFHLKYEVTGVLGCGVFGRVYQVRLREEEEQQQEDKVYAAKVCDLRKHSEDDIRDEYDMLALVPAHENCVQVIEAYFESPYSYIISESCGRPLVSAIARKQAISESTMVFYFEQALRGLEAIHAARVVHRDVKLDNLMVRDETVKLIDFGQAVKAPEHKDRERLGGSSGTPPFMSPEMVRGDGYGTGTDVWSLGVCLYTCMLGHFPYNGLVHDATVMKGAIRLGIPAPAFCFTGKVAARMGPMAMISEDAEHFLRSLLQRRPAKRPAAAEALQHAWIGRVAGVAHAAASDIDFRMPLEAAWEVGAFSKGNPRVNETMDQDMMDLQADANDFISYCSTVDCDNVT